MAKAGDILPIAVQGYLVKEDGIGKGTLFTEHKRDCESMQTDLSTRHHRIQVEVEHSYNSTGK